MTETRRRFRIALSFPGEQRRFVGEVARCLAKEVGEDSILYDKFREAEFARPDLDTYLPTLYRMESELIAVFLCAEYAKKRWCRLEWRSIRQLICTSDSGRIMFLSFDDIGDVPEIGILSSDGYALIGNRAPRVIAKLILQRSRQFVHPETAGGKVLLIHSPTDGKWLQVLRKHLDVPRHLGLVQEWEIPPAKARSDWGPSLEAALKGSCAAVLMVTRRFAMSELGASTELDRILRARHHEGVKMVRLLADSCGTPNLDWIPSVPAKRSQRPVRGQSRDRQESLERDAFCAKIADSYVADVINTEDVRRSVLDADLVRLHCWRTREKILASSAWVDTPFKWDLFALRICCQRYGKRPHAGPTIRCEDLLSRGVRRILLLGPPGSGKTTTCKRLTAFPPAKIVPLEISGSIPEGTDSIVDRFQKDSGLAIKNCEFLKEQLRNGNILLVADGISEERDMDATVLALEKLAAQPQLSKVRFLVTCRTGAYKALREDRFRGFRKLVLKELDHRAQSEFLAKQGRDVERAVRRAFDREPELQEICRNQFLFIVTVTLIAEEGPTGFVATRATIYQRFLERLLGRWEKLSAMRRCHMESFLKELAVDMRECGVNRSTISEDRVLELLRSNLKGANEKELTAELRYLLSLGLLHGKDTTISFFQETFQEFLCAKWLTENQRRLFPINDVICSLYNEIAGFGETLQ